MTKYAQRPSHVTDASFWRKQSLTQELDYQPLGRFWIRKTSRGYETGFSNCYGCIPSSRAMPLVGRHLQLAKRLGDARQQVRRFVESCKQYWR